MKKNGVIFGIILLTLAVYFIFVPAFQGRLLINPTLNLGFISLRWYGLILAAAILAGFSLARQNCWKFGISKQDVDDYSFRLVVLGILGARLYHVIFNLNYYSDNPLEIYQIWHGGLSIYGAVLAGLMFTYFYARNKAYTFWQLFDLIALSLPLSQAVGRLGNFVNQEAFGVPSNLPWKMFVALRNRPVEYINFNYFHPAFLYEIILNILVFFVLIKMLGRVKSGIIGLSYLLLYSLGRFFIESIRLDSFFILGFRIDQVVAFLIIIISGVLILKKHRELALLNTYV